MLSLKPNCERCAGDLPANSTRAMICTFECTFCRDCVEGALGNVCPNCGGGFQPRPIRPRAMLERHPASNQRVGPGFDAARHADFLARYQALPPEER